ncbi:hypothetical protein [Streptomyces sp. NPDC058872]|uniref:hypothetical protein n=1 Tax=Streptomyces sp. NPDC058872 TaxID=3346661 RepID=UPI0036ACB0BA
MSTAVTGSVPDGVRAPASVSREEVRFGAPVRAPGAPGRRGTVVSRAVLLIGAPTAAIVLVGVARWTT